MKIKKTFLLVLICCILLCPLGIAAGCTTADGQSDAYRTVIDGAGREVTVKSQVDSVVSLVTGITGIIYEINAEDKLVGVTKALPYPTTYYFPQVADMADVGSIANIKVEEVVGLDPDIVFTTEFFMNQAQTLEEMGITVLAIRLNSLSDLLWNFRFIGSILDKNVEAEALAESAANTITTIKGKTAELNERPKVYVESTSTSTYGAVSWCTESIISAGGINIYGDSPVKMPQTNMEYVLEQNPDVILIYEVAETRDEFVQKAKTRIDEMKSRPGWNTINAVQNSRFCVIENRYLGFGPEHIKSLEAMAKFFHPDLFNDIAVPEFVYIEGE